MKYKFWFILIGVFLTISNLHSQSTYFIKYKNSVAIQEIDYKVTQQKLMPSGINSPLDAELKSVNYLAKGLGKEDEVLSRIIKVNFNKSVLISNIYSLKKIDPAIEYIQKSTTYKMDFIPNDSLVGEQWALEKIQAFDAWDKTEGVDTVLLAIIDTGIDYLHPDLKNKIYFNPGENGTDASGNDKSSNGIDDDNNGFVDDFRGWDFVDRVGFPFDSSGGDYLGWDNDPMDENGHGTYIGGIAGAETNNIAGIAGVAPNIKILNIRSFDPGGSGEEDDAAAAIIYAVQMGAKVINMSFGDDAFSLVLRDVIRFAYARGVVLVGSSGNSGSTAPHYPSGYSEVISVGNSTINDFVSGNSNYGSTLDLVAPGSSIITTARNNNYASISGTSAATPHVAATAALILSLQHFTNEEVKQIIKSTTVDIGEPGWDERSGAGRLNLNSALTVLAPSIIHINHPTQDFTPTDDQFTINATVLSPFFISFSLLYGIGDNPDDWNTLIENGTDQFTNQDIYTLDVSSLSDSIYTLRLVVQLNNGRTLEERVNFHIIRSHPQIIVVGNGPIYYGDKSTIQAELYTNQPTITRMYYRKSGDTEFNFITLDGFTTNNQFIKQLHYGFIPLSLVRSSTIYEIYYEAENLAGLKTTILDSLSNSGYFIFRTDDPPEITNYTQMNFDLPRGLLFNNPVSFLSDNYDEVLFQTFYETTDLYFGLLKYQNNEFEKIDSINGKFPHLFGDFNSNGLKDLISTSRQTIFIDEQIEQGSFDSLVTKFTNEEHNNPLIADDLNSDGDYELITLSGDIALIKWDINSNLTISNADTFYTSADTLDQEPGYGFSNFPSTNIEIADINNDGKKEIWFLDDDGDLKSYIVEPSGSLTKGNSFITQGLTTRNQNIFSIGDYDGDGIKDFAILYQTNSIAPTFLLLVLTYRNDQFEIITQKIFLDQSAAFIGFSFSKVSQSLKYSDVDNDGVDELVLNIFPYAYILKHNNLGDKFIFFSDGVNTESVFAEDLNKNGVIDVAFQFSDGYKFLEFASSNMPSIPYFVSGYSVDSTSVKVTWEGNVDQYYIYRGDDLDNMVIIDSTFIGEYLDVQLQNETMYYYAVQAVDLFKPIPLSNLSSPIEVYVHTPGKVLSAEALSATTVTVTFSEKMNNTIENLQAFELMNVGIPNSVAPANQFAYLLTFREPIPIGDNQLLIKDLKDFYGSPIESDTVQFTMDSTIANQEFFISSFKIENPYLIRVTFNLNVDETSALNMGNYFFEPDNKAASINIDKNNDKTILIDLKGQKPVGSIGKEYVLRVKNVKSSSLSGNIEINSGAGSYIVLTGFANDLSDVYVYPNPSEIGTGTTKITFANLPQYANITIWTLNGTKVGEIEENDGNGGLDFNLKDFSGDFLSSGIYIYRIVMLDQFKNESDEKIGKFAVVR